MDNKTYKMCTNCVMDVSDEEISFDVSGVCNHCRTFDEVTSKNWLPNAEGAKKLESYYNTIKNENVNKDYDCILGLSGGVDSSYLALRLFESGLRPLVVHVDGGWNSELAVKNIESIISYCGWNLHTIVIDWPDMRELQLAYLKSGIANQDVPQDHAYFAALYNYATKYGINYVIGGGNIATESILPESWNWDAMDADNLHAINEKFGSRKLTRYKTISFFKLYFYYPFIKRMKTIRPLNFMPYNKRDALKELIEKTGYKAYERKHGESIFTKFFQNYWLPTKFGFDKRRAHLSSLIVSGQIARHEAIAELEKPLYDETELKEDKRFIAKKLGISNEEFERVLNMPAHDYTDFRNNEVKYQRVKKIQRLVSKILKRDLSTYS